MPKLTPEERVRLIRLIEEQSPLGPEWLDKLFPSSTLSSWAPPLSSPLASGELSWRGKDEARARVQMFLESLVEPSGSLPSPCVGEPPSQGQNQTIQLSAGQADPQSAPLPSQSQYNPSLPDDWAGLLFQGDNVSLLRYLLQNGSSLGLPPSPFSLIYIDPPFFTETDFHATTPHSAKKETVPLVHEGKAGQTTAQNRGYQSSDERVFAYSDTWGGGKAEYFTMLYERIMLMHALLSPKGILCVHCDWRAVPGLRFMLDECFGQDAFVNEIVWHYTGGGRSKRYFSRKHDSILVYAKGKEWTFNIDAVRVPYKETSGYAKAGIVSRKGKRYMPHPLGTPLDDVWNIPMVNPMAKERVAYATQKPRLLLRRLVQAFSNEGDFIGDFFCGSGTTLLEGLENRRRVVGCDFGALAVEVTHERLKDNGFLSKRHGWSALSQTSSQPLAESSAPAFPPSFFSFRSPTLS